MGAFTTGPRLECDPRHVAQVVTNNESVCELDSHADTCLLGKGWSVEEPTGEYCMVRPFDKSYEPVRMEIVSAITAFDHPNGKTYILVVNQALYSPQQEPSLLNPNQMRWNHLIVDDIPRQFDPRLTHSIRFPESTLTIPLCLRGVMSTFPIRVPTLEEKEECTHLTLTSRESWEPNSDLLASEEERATVRLQVDVSSGTTESARGLYAIESESACLRNISPVICEMNHSYEDRCLLQDLCESVRVCSSAVVERHVNAIAPMSPMARNSSPPSTQRSGTLHLIQSH